MNDLRPPPSVRILLVEDEERFAETVMDCLRAPDSTQSTVVTARTLHSALQRLCEDSFSVILLDLNLPDSLGLDTVRAVNSAAPDCAIIVLTAANDADLARLMLRSGAQDFLTKSEVDGRGLHRAISYSIERKKADRALRESRTREKQLQMSQDAILRATPAALASVRPDWSIIWANDAMQLLLEALGKPCQSLRELFTTDASFHAYETSARQRTSGSFTDRRELILHRIDNVPIYCEISLTRLDPSAEDSGFLATLTDVTDRALAEDQRATLMRLSQRLTGASSIEAVGIILAEECRILFQHDAFWFGHYDATGNTVRHICIEDTAVGECEPKRIPLENPVHRLDKIPHFASGQLRLVNRPKDHITGNGLAPIGHVHRQSQSLIFAPVSWENQAIAVISVQSYKPGRYGESELVLLGAFADQCGAVLARLKAEEELQKREVLYRGIVEDQTEVIIRLNPDMSLTFMNHAFLRSVGGTAKEHTGREFTDFIPPHERNRVRLQLSLLSSDVQVVDVEHALLDSEGQVIRLVWTYRAILNQAGNVQTIQAVGTDVTRLRLAESALARSEQRLELIVSQIPALLYTTDQELHFTTVLGRGPGTIRKTDSSWSSTSLMGKNVRDVLRRRERDCVALEAHELALTTGLTAEYGMEWEGRQYQARVEPLRKADGSISGVVAIALDVTEQHIAAQHRQRLQEDLYKAEKLAAIGRTMATIGHCMKNMLTGLNGSLFLVDRCLEADESNQVLRQAKDMLKRSSSRISLLLLNMLDVSRERRPSYLRSSVKDMLDEVVRDIHGSAASAGIEVTSEISTDAEMFNLDPDRLFRALLNLSLNALDSMGPGGCLRLRAALAQPAEVKALFQKAALYADGVPDAMPTRIVMPLEDLPDSALLRLEVEDSGTGISPENLAQLFEPFFSTKLSRGTGLGLAATRQFIEVHGGYILVESIVDKGTRFILLLPDQPEGSEAFEDLYEELGEPRPLESSQHA